MASTTSSRKYAPRIFSKKEQEEMLVGYRVVPKNEWTTLTRGIHIRLEKIGGKFLRGGWVERVLQEIGTNASRIELTTGINHVKFTMEFKNIQKIWAKGVPVISMEALTIANITARVAQLEEQQMRTQNILKKLIERISAKA